MKPRHHVFFLVVLTHLGLNEVTRHAMPGSDLAIRWILLKANIDGYGTTCIKVTPPGWIRRIGYIALQNNAVSLHGDIWVGHRHG